MRKLIALFLFLFLCGAAFGQLSQFRMIGSGSWSVVNDSTFSSTVTIQSDLTSNGFLPTGIADTMKVFSQTGQRYRISSATNLTFSGADLIVVESGGDWGAPVGQIMIYEANSRNSVPNIPFGATGATAKMQESVDSYNSTLIGSSTLVNCTDSSFVSADTLFLRHIDCGIDTILFSIPVPPDTAYVSNGELIIVWNGDVVNSDTIPLGSGLPVIASTPTASDTTIVSYSGGSINDLNAINVADHILFSDMIDGGEYTLRVSNVADSLSLDDRLFWIDETGAPCNTQVKTPNATISFYFNGSSAWVTSSIPNLSCYTPIISSGAEYAAIIANAQANGHSLPTPSVQIAGDSLISELKTLGVWDSLDQMLVLATDGDAGFSLINWVNPGTNNADTIGSPTFTTLAGWSTDATTTDDDEAINLLYNPTDDGVNWKQNYATFIYDYTGTQEQAGFHFGSNANPKARGEINTKAFLNGTVEFVHAAHGGAGFVQYSRTGTTLQVFKNGSSHASTTSATTGIGSNDFYLMALELSGAPFGESGGLTYRLYMSGGDLSSFAADIDTAWDHYLSQLGL